MSALIAGIALSVNGSVINWGRRQDVLAMMWFFFSIPSGALVITHIFFVTVFYVFCPGEAALRARLIRLLKFLHSATLK